MSPVEPRPLVIAAIGLPSTDGADGFCFLPKLPAAFNSEPVSRLPLVTPSAAKKERRLQPSFKLMRSFLSTSFAKLFLGGRRGWIDHQSAAHDFNQRIAGNPFQRHTRPRRRFARGEVGPVYLVQRVVLRFVRIEPGLARRHRNTVRER